MNQAFHNPNQEKRPSSTASAVLEVEGIGKFPIGQIATVGRSAESQIALNLPSISRNHARIFFEGGHYWIKDLDSANGTSINGKRAKLQMLSDQDQIGFGDVKAIFRTAARAGGPAALGQDPLAGIEIAVPDGTPTGGLDEHGRVVDASRPATVNSEGFQGSSPREAEIGAFTSRIEDLQAENDRLRRELTEYRSTPSHFAGGSASPPEQAEIDRLRALVSRLERALADSNLRFRNLQQKLEGPKS
jgi:predicted component of type VI protein secretion system